MKKIKKSVKTLLIFVFAMLVTNCAHEETSTQPDTDQQAINASRNWFTDYKAEGNFLPLFQELEHQWESAANIKLQDGTMAVRLPLKDVIENPEYMGEKMLYIYPWGKGYIAQIHELFPFPRGGKIIDGFKNLDTFTGFIITWDLRDGFVKGAGFENGENIYDVPSVEINTDDDTKTLAITHKAPPIDLNEVLVSTGSGSGKNHNPSVIIRYTPPLAGGGTTGSGGQTNNPGGSGGSGGSASAPGSNNDPCYNIHKLVANANFIAKMDELRGKTNLKFETGYSQSVKGPFTPLTAIGKNQLDLPTDPDIIGYIHTHIEPYDSGEVNPDGEPIIYAPVKIFSPQDIGSFLSLVKNAHNNKIPIMEVYGTMVSSSGTYQLRFTSDDISEMRDLNWRSLDEVYKTYFIKDNVELGFLKFLGEIVKINNLELYKINKDGTSERKLMNVNKALSGIKC